MSPLGVNVHGCSLDTLCSSGILVLFAQLPTVRCALHPTLVLQSLSPVVHLCHLPAPSSDMSQEGKVEGSTSRGQRSDHSKPAQPHGEEGSRILDWCLWAFSSPHAHRVTPREVCTYMPAGFPGHSDDSKWFGAHHYQKEVEGDLIG